MTSHRELQTVWQLVTTIAAVGDADEMLRLALTGLPKLVPCDTVGIAVASDGLPGEPPAGTGGVETASRALRRVVSGDGSSRWRLRLYGDGRLLSEEAVRAAGRTLGTLLDEIAHRGAFAEVEAGDACRDGAGRAALERLGFRRMAAAPLRTASRSHGLLLAGRSFAGSFSDEDRLHLSCFAQLLAIELERAAARSVP